MAFNWFKRSYEEPEQVKDPDDFEDQPEEQAKATEPEAASANSEDYLNWAKAAYQNIQARQGESTTAETADDAGVETGGDRPPTDSPTEPEEPTKDLLVDQTSDELAEAPEAPISEVSSDPEEANADADLETATEVETVDTRPEMESSAAEAAAVPAEALPVEAATESPESSVAAQPAQPFWAKAQAEREARLERLQAEAILEPEPEPEPAARQPEFEPLDIDLDEAFLWSAEVLAAQGRRPDQISLEEITWLNKLRQGLGKTRRGLVNQLKAIVGQGPLNDEAVDEIEALLLQADVGVSATDYIISALQARLREETLPPEQAISYLKSLLRDMLDAPLSGGHNLTFTPEKDRLSIWLMTGVNGAGKTTTIGKIAHIATKSGFSCLIGAADTFRAAAVEQVKVWGARSGVEVIANPGQNTDPASVVFDAISAATSRNTELLLIDTAGRLQNKKNLMDELSKVRRIIDKKAPDASVESLLVLDATLGQNGLRQAQVFSESAQLSGVVLTKLDGTARGGVALAVVQQLGLPIRFIGAGEGIEDLRPFSSYEFVEALLSG